MSNPVTVNKFEVQLATSSLGPEANISPSLIGSAARYNALLNSVTVSERISRVLTDFPTCTVATTSGGIQSGLLLGHLANLQQSPDKEIRLAARALPIIFIDTGDLFPETVAYIADLKQQINLNIIRCRHALSDEELSINLQALCGSGLTLQSAFDELTKVRPMRAILNHYGAKVWIAGNRRDQSKSRTSLPLATVQNDTLKVYPIVDIPSEALHESLSKLGVPPHPLADIYRSVGNRSDTKISSGPYEKSGRHAGLKEECGLHEAWARRGKTLLKSPSGIISCERIPIQQCDFSVSNS